MDASKRLSADDLVSQLQAFLPKRRMSTLKKKMFVSDNEGKIELNKPIISPDKKEVKMRKIQSIPLAEIAMGDVLGKGSFGTVHKAFWSNTTVAIKSFCFDDEEEAQQQLKEFYHELYLMFSCDCANIVKLYGLCKQPPNYYLVLEYMDRGTLYHLLMKQREKLTNKQIVNLASDIILGIEYLHSKKMLHRDLKSLNILLCSDAANDWKAKIADFGTSKVKHQMAQVKTLLGTQQYMAPEILNGEEYSFPVDIWAFGMILYEMLTNQLPYTGKNWELNQYRKFIYEKGERPDWNVSNLEARKLHPALKDICERCWKAKPSQRPSPLAIYGALMEIKQEI